MVNQDAEAALFAIDDSYGSKADQTLRSLKRLFVGCQHEFNDTLKKAQKVQEMLDEFGGWPVIDPTWNFDTGVPPRFKDSSYTMGWLFARYSISNILMSGIKVDDFGQYRALISGPAVSVSKCADPSDPIWDQLRDIMTTLINNLVQTLGISVSPAQLTKDINDMVSLEQRICQLPTQVSPILLPIESAQVRWPNIHWEKYLDAAIVDLFGYEVSSSCP